MDAEPSKQPKQSKSVISVLPLVLILVLLILLYLRYQYRPSVITGLESTVVESLALEPFYMPAAEQGQPKTTADLQGKVTLLSFWATWCGPCRLELPHLGSIASRFAEVPDVQIWTVLTDRGADAQTKEAVTDLFAEAEVSLPVYVLSGPLIPESLLPEGIPASLLIGPDGKVAGAWMGYDPNLENEVAELVAKLLDVEKIEGDQGTSTGSP